MIWAIPVVMWSKTQVCSHSLAGIMSLNPAKGMDVSVSCECCVCVVRGPCDGLILHPQKSYPMLCV